MPALSRPRASIMLAQGNSATLRVQAVVPVAFVQLPPFTRTSTLISPLAGEPGSLAVPETVMGVVTRFAAFVGLVIATIGGVMSILTVNVTGVEVFTLPAAS